MKRNYNNPDLNKRLRSLDALRGLDMFFLVGLGGIFRALPELSDNKIFHWLADQCRHPEWQGFTAWDLIFPMFIFIVGVAMPLSFSKRMAMKDGKKKLYKHVAIRSLTLAILGVILWQQPGGAHPEWGFYSVLYRIGFSYFFAALILMNTNVKQQIFWAFGILAGYWLILRFVPVPGYGPGDLSREGNLNTYIGEQIAKIISPNFSNVLSLSLIPSISNALFGVIAGHWLRSNIKQTDKVLRLMIAGAGLIIAALIVHLDFPVNKKLSSPSFILLTSGISAVLLSLFYWLIDVKGRDKWAFFFVVVGMNSITIYLANSLVKFNNVANVFTGGFELGNAQALVFAITVAIVKWLFLYYLYKQKIFLKI